MTDLVSRLRERHSFLCDEAAEEIERLHGIIADNSLLNRTDNERLRGLLGEAADDIEHWGGYASEYFKDKWHLEDDIKKYRDAALAGEPAAEPAKTADQPPTVLTNPWNGEPRDIRDVESDPTGILMVEPGKPLRAADQPNVAPSIEWRLTTEKINDLQIDSIKRLIPRCKAAHFVNVRVRINGTWEEYQADWIKHMVRIERAADPTPAPQPQCACEYYWPGQGHHPDCPTRATNPTSVSQDDYDALAARLAEAERVILRMAGEGFARAKIYVDKYDLTGEQAARATDSASGVDHGSG